MQDFKNGFDKVEQNGGDIYSFSNFYFKNQNSTNITINWDTSKISNK